MLNTTPHPAATAPGPGARALYLGTRDKKHVACTAEALVVRNERAQTMRYPLVRVARVVSSTVVDWSGAALALCLQNGIGISWINARGDALGTCYPHPRQHPQLTTALELWLESPTGRERYQHWLRGRRLDVLMRWGQTKPDSITPASWENTKREWVYHRQFRVHLPHALRGHLLAYVGSQLSTHGAPPLLWDENADAIDLDADLCELLWAEMNLCTGDLADSTHTDKEVIVLFERWIATNGAAMLLNLNHLYRTARKAFQE
jgi:hypothetical protein